MSKRDYIYYDYRLRGKKPNNKIALLYCYIRKIITIKESPSKVTIWLFERESDYSNEKR